MPGGVLGADQWPLLSLTLGERGEGKGEGGEQRENEPDKGHETNPSHSAEPGEDRTSCQHLSLVKCSLTDNVTLITESPDSDILSSVSRKQCQPNPHTHTHTQISAALFPSKYASSAFNFF